VNVVVPPKRARYLAEIAEAVRGYLEQGLAQSRIARDRQSLLAAKKMSGTPVLDTLIAEKEAALGKDAKRLLDDWPATVQAYSGDESVTSVRGRELRTKLTTTSLSGTKLPKVALPKFEDAGEIPALALAREPAGRVPFTAGVFPFKRENEDPTRMFAGEGDAFRTNRRFHLLSKDMPAKRLSTAFDSVTLYGFDPDERPDIYGKVGNSGVSIATLEDMKVLYSGFDLCAPNNSVSMTINGPAPTIPCDVLQYCSGSALRISRLKKNREPTKDEKTAIRAQTLKAVRGTCRRTS
jgi:methylmalonyl-CoA mutase